MEKQSLHIPVLVDEVTNLLDLQPGEVVIDATVGDGGHANKILEHINPGGFLLGIDRDPEAVTFTYEKLSINQQSNQFAIRHGSYCDLDVILKNCGYSGADGILFDLGLSSRQLSNRRGFSFKETAPLDMRFDPESELTAEEIVNSYPKDKLANLLWEFGEERASRRIADAIFKARQKNRIATTTELADIVSSAKGGRKGKIHPATQTFQALRIAVNQELEAIRETLPKAIDLLHPSGRLAVISYHSLEDRIVKQQFRNLYKQGQINLITKKPVRATRSEILNNPRARSAKLRVIEKI
ncbi:16S rRNA (cytosine(1402)-N(4))-methyltransferase RsmH [Patescibacteria group bacterium]|nr:16S rRNA (cytosine(1402)-N(4))-methyltransferase RsmH [Patescibacteria group bacterium]